jgi:2-iminobutanoate/2-iminopropanoate deaminase
MNSTGNTNSRRSMIKSFLAVVTAAGAGLFGASTLASREGAAVQVAPGGQAGPRAPLFSGVKTHGDLVYVAGKGEHSDGDITAHTISVLNQIEQELLRAGSSMDKVLKVNVYLHDIRDYAAMNEAYRGRFGDNPPVRTTVACYGGIPGSSLVEIDAIAHL